MIRRPDPKPMRNGDALPNKICALVVAFGSLLSVDVRPWTERRSYLEDL